MTTCLRSFVFNWNPKLCLIKARSSTSHAGFSRPQSTSLSPPPSLSPHPSSSSISSTFNEFLNEVTASCKGSYPEISSLPACSWAETRSLVPVGLITPSSATKISFLEDASCSVECRSYDPRLHTIPSKPLLSFASDDIILTCGKNVSSFLEDDLRRDVYQRDVFVVDTLDGASLSAKIGAFHRLCSPLSEYEKSMILSSDVSTEPKKTQDPMGKPTEEQLEKILLTLSDNLPKFFTKTLNYHIYHKDLVFQNNIRGVTTHGLSVYIRQMSLLRLIAHLKFAYVKMEVLKVTKHEEDGTIRVRWRIRGIPGYKILFQFWKYRLWQYNELLSKQSDWYDAISTFYVGGDGLVHRHVCDKMMRDENKEKTTGNLAAKLALLLGAIPRPSADDLGAMVLSLAKLQDTSNIENTDIYD